MKKAWFGNGLQLVSKPPVTLNSEHSENSENSPQESDGENYNEALQAQESLDKLATAIDLIDSHQQ